MHIALHDLLINQYLQRLVTRVLIYIKCMAILGNTAALCPLAADATISKDFAQVDHVAAVAHYLQLMLAVYGCRQLQHIVGAEFEHFNLATTQIDGCSACVVDNQLNLTHLAQ